MNFAADPTSTFFLSRSFDFFFNNPMFFSLTKAQKIRRNFPEKNSFFKSSLEMGNKWRRNPELMPFGDREINDRHVSDSSSDTVVVGIRILSLEHR
ncbi:hypothetical protein JTE90_009256 [Oedothorax gibbosus]|uniref:Uncharacterized protein n=1 Tax=Oedothorax gibbosus TaxID=931172 RepID=A0AAV6V388_9ARAC|nr:hypothetical protein JTE90_009256 [Oedothorax gibbosus]